MLPGRLAANPWWYDRESREFTIIGQTCITTFSAATWPVKAERLAASASRRAYKRGLGR